MTPPPGTPIFPQGMMPFASGAPAPMEPSAQEMLAAPSLVPRQGVESDDKRPASMVSDVSPTPTTPLPDTPRNAVKDELEEPRPVLPTDVIIIEDDVDLLGHWEKDVESESDTYSESESSSSSDSDAQDQDDDGLLLDEPRMPSSRYFINHRSLVLHCLKSPKVFRCGRQCTDSYTVVAELNGLKCGKCFPD